MYGVIYKITNSLNGKIYIGQTTNKNPFKRINYHFKKTKSKDLVYQAYLKYGKDIFNIEILCSCYTKEDLNHLEEYFINYYNCQAEIGHGYNIKFGGSQGGKCSISTKKKISDRANERYMLYGSKLKGIKFSKEHCDNLSKVRKGFDSPARKEVRKKTIEKLKQPLIAINILTEEEYYFSSIQECANSLNLIHSCISRVLRGDQNRKQHNGYKFKYLKKE